MPLHLLGKKSWNVYNQDNIAKVHRDEAAAELREKEIQRHVDEVDAESRLQTLRGVPKILIPVNELHGIDIQYDDSKQRSTKRRRLDGEDDTDRDIRLARQLESLPSTRSDKTTDKQPSTSLIGKDGHINLFSATHIHKSKGNDEVAAERAKKERDLEDQYTMRFANAAGKSKGSDQPWYTGSGEDGRFASKPISKNVWGNEDPRRRERETKRMDANDPLAAIKKGVKQLREVDKHREEWRAQRERDLNEVEELARKHKHRRKRRHDDEDSLDGFHLDDGYEEGMSEHRGDGSESRRHHRRHKHGSRPHHLHRSRP